MRAVELPSIKSIRRRPSPLPVTLAALLVLLVLRLSAWSPSTVSDANAIADSDVLLDIAPAAAPLAEAAPPAPPIERQVNAEPSPEALFAAFLAPSAGPIDLTDDPLRAEPFLEERRELARQHEALQVRQLALEVAEQRLREHLERLTALRDEVEARLTELEGSDDARIEQLVALYETMKPKKAAVIFDELDFEVLVPLALRMSERKLAPIVAAMAPKVARELTAELAKRRHDETLATALSETTPR